jgi:pimeloyl-ACP methyl ester carboxylesterase
VLFVRGEKSPLLSARAAAELAALCRDGAWIEIANAHHHVPLDQPEALAAAIDDFLAARGLRR